MTAEELIKAWIRTNILMPRCLYYRPVNFYKNTCQLEKRNKRL
jgi:hypothetical protein